MMMYNKIHFQFFDALKKFCVEFIGVIDVDDGCWRQNVLVTSLRCW